MPTHVVQHPIVTERLTRLRNELTERPDFRRNLHELSLFVIYEALRSLDTTTIDIDTPLEPTIGVAVTRPPLVIPVMRAGLGMLDAALLLLPEARVGFLGLKRNEETLLPDSYVNTVPDDLEGRDCLILDPMLATGGSLVHTCDILRQSNAGALTVACVLAAPEGIAALEQVHADVECYTGSIDASLNEVAFIRPGLGDAGDRQFGLA